MIKYLKNPLFLLLLVLIFLSGNGLAQVQNGGLPSSFDLSFAKSVSRSPISSKKLPPPKIKDLDAEDKNSINRRRFAAAIPVNFNLNNSGDWLDLENGDRIWRLQLEAPQALSLRVFFQHFFLPEGATLFIYSVDRQIVRGAFTSFNNKSSGRFATTPIPRDQIILEYYEPASVRAQGRLDLFRVDYGYRDYKGQNNSSDKGFEDSGDCNINVNCSLGDNWQDEKRGIVKIILTSQNGSDWCTGSMINNTAEDRSPLFLSADHCLDDMGQSFVDTWGFIFNFEGPDCDNPSFSPSEEQSIVGATLLSNYANSDFALMELSVPVPFSYNAYFNGWDNSGNSTQETVCIHHPSGDIKKISIDRDSPQLSSYLGDPGSGSDYLRVAWNDESTTEGGSSGSPLFDTQGLIIGQLHGGFAACTDLLAPDYYGRLFISWDGGGSRGNRLSDWLDPLGQNVSQLFGVNNIQPLHDLLITSISTNVDACDFSESTPINVQIFNQGSSSESSAQLDYQVYNQSNVLLENNTLNIPFIASSSSLGVELNLDFGEANQVFRVEVQIRLNSDENLNNNDAQKEFYSLQNDRIQNYPYSANFESSKEGWQSGGVNNDWERARPQGNIISQAADGEYAWVTNASGDYRSSQNSFLQSPSFDFSTLNDPYFRADIFVNLEANFDGVQLQFTRDQGVTWEVLGAVGQGENWYNNNSNDLSFGASGFPNQAWSGLENNWKKAVFRLEGLGGECQVQFRFLMISDFSVIEEGFAVDNVVISDGLLSDDVGIEITQVGSDNCTWDTATPVQIKVSNNGQNSSPSLNLEYFLYDKRSATLLESGLQNLTSIAAGSSLNTQFNLNLSQDNIEYELQVELNFGQDGNQSNNTQNLVFWKASKVSSFPYLEGFENDNIPWYGSGTNSTWQRGVPNANVINRAFEGTQVWATNLSGNHSENENSYLLSPIFDLRNLSQAEFQADLFIHSEENYDGTQLQISEDCGETWLTLGQYDNGVNAYDNNNATNLPFTDFTQVAWSALRSDWKRVRFNLDSYAGQDNIQLRFLFRADNTLSYEGIAIDNIQINDIVNADEDLLSQSLKIYPNPVNTKTLIQFERGLNLGNRLHIRLLNAYGQSVLEETFENLASISNTGLEIDLSVYPKGLYLLELNTEKGKIQKKLIKY